MILVIEDSDADVRLMKYAVGESSVKLATAKSCSEALRMLSDSRFRPDLVIADMGVLEFQGVELLKTCRPRSIPVVIFSGSLNPADEQRAIQMGAKEFVIKPANLDDYTDAVWGMIRKWQIAPPAPPQATKHLEILLVEDNEGDSRLIQRITAESTVTVHTTIVGSCSGALAMVAGGKLIPNLVITDMSVTGPGSPEFVRYCNANDIPVVVFSASLNPALRSEILRLGVKEFVEKPYNIDEYRTTLWRLIWKWAIPR